MKSSIIIYSLLLGLLLGPFLSCLQAQTILNGRLTQDTTITASGNPYEVGNNFIVPHNITLTVKEGVKIWLDSTSFFELRGTLLVEGTATDSVYLMGKNASLGPNAPRRVWDGIVSDSATVHARYMVGAHAYNMFYSAAEELKFTHCSFLYNDFLTGDVILEQSFDSCYVGYGVQGISFAANQGGHISHTVIEHCTNGVFAVWGGVDVRDCRFSHITELALGYRLHASGLANRVENSIFEWSGTAIGLYTMVGGSSVGDSMILENNEIRDNKIGIDVSDPINNPTVVGIVQNNVICNDSFNVVIAAQSPVDFSNNCWCQPNIQDIMATINLPPAFPINNNVLFTPFYTNCINGEVYPGDANHDQVADVLDILTIGQYFGQTGTPRPNATLSWQGQPSPNWGITQPSGYDLKHADCNGDSTIGWSDTLAVRLNYGRTHRSRRTASVSGIPLILQAPATVQNPGDTVRLPIALGTVDTIANNIYGIAFSIHYDSTQLAPHPSVAFFNSWLGNPGTDLITFWHLDSVDHRVDVAFVRTNGQARTGFGQIAELVVVIDDDITKREVPLRLSFSNVHAIDTAGNMIAVSDFVDRTLVEVEYFGNLFRAYPNPASNFIFVEPKTSAPYDVMLVDMTGKQWIVRQNLIGKQQISLANKPGGLYVLRAHTGGISESFKVVHP